MREDEQRFPAWPLITAVVSHSQRTGSYTARIDYPNAPARILARPELQPLRSEVITQVQRWTNDDWHKPVRLQVDDPDGRWLLGVPRDGTPVQLDARVPDPPARPTPASPPAAASRRTGDRFTLTGRHARLRGHRLAAALILAGAVVLLIVAAVPHGSSPARHHQTPITHTISPAAAVSSAAARTTPQIATTAKVIHRHTGPARRPRSVSRRHVQSRHRTRSRSHVRRLSTAPPAGSPPTSQSRTRPATATRSAHPVCRRPTRGGRIPPAAC
jgi:hypothetical protein